MILSVGSLGATPVPGVVALLLPFGGSVSEAARVLSAPEAVSRGGPCKTVSDVVCAAAGFPTLSGADLLSEGAVLSELGTCPAIVAGRIRKPHPRSQVARRLEGRDIAALRVDMGGTFVS